MDTVAATSRSAPNSSQAPGAETADAHTVGTPQSLGVVEARDRLSALVDAARGGRATRVRKGRDVAVVAPLSWMGWESAQKLPLRSMALADARPKMGELIAQAADGMPLVLTRYGTALALLIADIQLDEEHLASAFPFGLKTLDDCTGSITGGMMVVAGARGAGAGLLAQAVARQVGVVAGKPVLYAVSGPVRRDIADSMTAASASVNYSECREGGLSDHDAAVVKKAAVQLSRHVLYIDGADVSSAESVANVANWRNDLALVVVDRFRHQKRKSTALSGDGLPDAARTLQHMSRTRHLPVLCVLDTDNPEVIDPLEAEATLIITRHGQRRVAKFRERGKGEVVEVLLPE